MHKVRSERRTISQAITAIVSLGVLASFSSQAVADNFTRNFAKRYQKVAHSGYTIASNVVVTDVLQGTSVDIDRDISTFNSSSARLVTPAGAEIRAAYLVVMGTVEGGQQQHNGIDKFLFRGPGFDYTDVPESSVDTRPMRTYYNGATGYRAFSDVTAIVKKAGDGAYMVANVHHDKRAGKLNAAGWALFVVYESDAEACRQVSVFDGLAGFSGPLGSSGGGGQNDYDETIVPLSGMRSPSWSNNAVHGNVAYISMGGSTKKRGYWNDHWHMRNWWGGYPHPGDGSNNQYDYFNGTATIIGQEQVGRVPGGYVGKDYTGTSTISPNFDAEIMGVDPVNGFAPGVRGGDMYWWPMAAVDEIHIGLWGVAIDQPASDCGTGALRTYDDQLSLWTTNAIDPALNDRIPANWSLDTHDSVSRKGANLTRRGSRVQYTAPQNAANTDSFGYTVCNPTKSQCLSGTVSVASDAFGKTANEGLSKTSSISGKVWRDLNKNGIQDDATTAMSQRKVSLFTKSGNLVSSVQTWKDGSYLFSDVPAGAYDILVSRDCTNTLAPPNKGNDRYDSDFVAQVEANGSCTSKAWLTLGEQQHWSNLDVGEFGSSNKLGLWIHGSTSIVQGESFEVAWSNVPKTGGMEVGVYLHSANNNDSIQSVSTSSKEHGSVRFPPSLAAGEYQIRLVNTQNGQSFHNIDLTVELPSPGLSGSLNADFTKPFKLSWSHASLTMDSIRIEDSAGNTVSTHSTLSQPQGEITVTGLLVGSHVAKLIDSNSATVVAEHKFEVLTSGNEPTVGVAEMGHTGALIPVYWVNGSGHDHSWIGIFKAEASNQEYLHWTYLNARVAGSTEFDVTLPKGEYELRLFKDNGYTEVARSAFRISSNGAVIDEDGGDGAATTQISLGSWEQDVVGHWPLAQWEGGSGDPQSWVAIANAGSPNTQYLWWSYIDGKKDGEHRFKKTLSPGQYELRLYKDAQYDLLTRHSFEVKSSSASTGTASIQATPSTIAASGGYLKLDWENGTGHSGSWIGLFRKGTNNYAYLQWSYIDGKKAGSFTFNVPGSMARGDYEARLFSDGGYNRIASVPFTIQ